MNIVEDLKSKNVKPILLLELPVIKELPKEIIDIETKYFDKFGINNITSEIIKIKRRQIQEQDRVQRTIVAENEINKTIVNMFGMYKVVTYKTMDNIASQYNLLMTGLNMYNKPIPELNLQELEDFSNFLSLNKDEISKLNCKSNDSFIFNNDLFSFTKCSFDKMFYIMAPKSHLKQVKNYSQIGNEYNHTDIKPKFKFKLKFNAPEVKDPIIFLPIIVFNKIYCVIITAWDHVADDTRIRQML